MKLFTSFHFPKFRVKDGDRHSRNHRESFLFFFINAIPLMLV